MAAICASLGAAPSAASAQKLARARPVATVTNLSCMTDSSGRVWRATANIGCHVNSGRSGSSALGAGVEGLGGLDDGGRDLGIASLADVGVEENAVRLDRQHGDPGGCGG